MNLTSRTSGFDNVDGLDGNRIAKSFSPSVCPEVLSSRHTFGSGSGGPDMSVSLRSIVLADGDDGDHVLILSFFPDRIGEISSEFSCRIVPNAPALPEPSVSFVFALSLLSGDPRPMLKLNENRLSFLFTGVIRTGALSA